MNLGCGTSGQAHATLPQCLADTTNAACALGLISICPLLQALLVPSPPRNQGVAPIERP